MKTELNKKSIALIESIEKLLGFSIRQFCTPGDRPMSYFNLDIHEIKKTGLIKVDLLVRKLNQISTDYKKFTISENGGYGLAISFVKESK